MGSVFKNPNEEQDGQFLSDEERRRGSGGSWTDSVYKPKASDRNNKVNNMIRILPAKAGSAATYYLRVAKHFIKHADRTEAFLCLKETLGQPCPACEIYEDKKKKDPKLASNFSPLIRGVFNVIDRTEDPKDAHVRIYESPIKGVCTKVVSLVRSKGPMSDIFDSPDENFKITKSGRDLVIIFNPKADPQDMYMVYPADLTPMSEDPKQVEWKKRPNKK